MDRNLVEAKLESLRRCVERIAAKTPSSADQLTQDPDLQDIIALNLQRAVQLSVDLASHLIAETDARPPSTMAENFESLKNLQFISPALSERMMKAVGFRNIAVHSYQAIDWNIVFQICSHRLEDFRQFAKSVTQQLNPDSKDK
jgi:uncharacterized protein YutE (UPF0331/DUF86 family)